MGLSLILGTTGALGGTGVVSVLAHGAFHPRAQLFGRVLWRGIGEEREIALTFDDGPTPGVTEPILDALASADARATFFVIGCHARAHADLVRRIHDEGHLIGNHTQDHHRHGLFHRDAYWRDQIRACGQAVQDAIGLRPRLFRPPMGFTSTHIMRGAQTEGCTTITWSRRAFDTASRSPASVERRVLSGLRPGEIVLLHDGIDGKHRRPPRATVPALPTILRELQRLEFRCERLDDLLGLEPYAAS